MQIFDRTRRVDKIVADASGHPDEHGLVLNLLTRLKQQEEIEFRDLMESLWGSDSNPERYAALDASLRNLIELGIAEEPETAVFRLTDLGERYMQRDVRYFELNGYSRSWTYPVAHWLGDRAWRMLNRIEGEIDPFTYREPLSEEVRDEFLCAFEQRFRLYSFLIAATLVGVVIVDCLIGVPNQAYGLMLDIEGAVIIALGLVRGHHGIGMESGSNLVDWERAFRMSHSLSDLVIESYKTVDAIWGSALLIMGFSIQIIALSVA